MKSAKSGKKKIGLIIVICILTVLLILAVGAAFYLDAANEYFLDLTIHGEQNVTLEYGEGFTDPGAEAVFYGTIFNQTPVNVPVITEGWVDPAKLGSYELVYRAEYGGMVSTASRKVAVVDTVAPEITLYADPEGYTLPGHSYEEEGFTATDNYDGDITDKVQREEVDGKVIYTVSDSSGNTARAERVIAYGDPVAPEITLLGETRIEMEIGNAYVEPGFQAQDNADGDLTDRVVVEGEVSKYEPGIYPIAYIVTDSSGNTTTVTREVVMRDITPQVSGGVIYLTFDDGPSAYTSELLDVLDKYNVKVTFFVTNSGYGSVIARAAEAGHTVAIHTASHKYGQIYASEEAFFDDLYKMQGIIESYTGQKSMLMRFPGGSSNTVSSFNPGIMTRLTKAVQERGFHYFDWNVDSYDAGGASSSAEVAYNVIRGVSRYQTSVVLQHDTHGFSVRAVERIIQWGLANGYTFCALNEDSPGCHHGVNN